MQRKDSAVTLRSGKRIARTRTFSLGFSVVRLCLDKSYATPLHAEKQIGALHIPTKWGGTLRLHGISLDSGKNVAVRLYYKDGTIGMVPSSDEINAGTNALTEWEKIITYEVPQGKMGWFFVAAEGENKVKIGNSFIQEHSAAHYKISDAGIVKLTGWKVPKTVTDKFQSKINQVFKGDKAFAQMLVSLLGTADAQKYLVVSMNAMHYRPWNSWYWPGALAKAPHLYDVKAKVRVGVTKSGQPYRPAAPTQDGPLAKYDTFTASTDPAAEYEWEEMGKDIPSDDVGGHCDAIAWGGMEEDRPSGPKIVASAQGASVTLTEHDRLGLLTERYWGGWSNKYSHDYTTPQELFSKRDNYLRADWFHEKLRTRIAENNGCIQIHDERNWNYLVYKFRSKYTGFGTLDTEIRKIKIATTMSYVHWGTGGTGEQQKWLGGPVREITTTYEIEFKTDGTVAGQVTPWKKECIQNGKSKPITAVWYSNTSAPTINTKVDKVILESLYR